MARGRYDQPAHQIPKPIIPNIQPTFNTFTDSDKESGKDGATVERYRQTNTI
jgi:hypothetical protein